MFSKLKVAFERLPVARVAPLLFIITLMMMWMVNGSDLSFSVPHIKKLSGGAGIPDVLFSYTTADLYHILEALTPAGREAYTHLLIGFDFIFPFMYTLAFSTCIAVLYQGSPWALFIKRVPYLAGLFDWLENICILMTLAAFPKNTPIADFAGYATTIKYSTVICLLLLCFGILLKCFRILNILIKKLA